MTKIPGSIRHAGLVAITAFLGLPTAYAIEIAGSLEVSLDATNYTNGNPWTNTGALSGDFFPLNTPKRENVWGHEAVLFDGWGDAFRGPDIVDMAGNSARTVEVWAFQGQIKNEETLVSWGRRGGGGGTNTSFMWGTDREWGAHGGWEQNYDLGWNPTPGNNPGGGVNDLTNVPTAGQWHLLTYVYDPNLDGGTLSVYDNGALKNSQSGIFLNTHSGFSMIIGSQNDPSGTIQPGILTVDNIFFSGAIARVRVHNGALSPSGVAANYAEEAAEFATSQSAAFLSAGPVHRYTFNNLSSGADGTIIPDVIGGADGVLRGSGAVPKGTTGLDLPGGSPINAAYVDLPNNLISSRTNISLEVWITVEGVDNWSRIMDFGTTNIGEIDGPSSQGYGGTNYIMLSAFSGSSFDQRFEHVGGSSSNFHETDGLGYPMFRDAAMSTILGVKQHVVFTFNDDEDEWRYYRDGMLMEVISDSSSLFSIPDVNNWLGRSQYSGDFNTDATYDEFRIYDYALSPAEVMGNYLAGPDVINIPEPGSLALLMAATGMLGWRRRRARR